MKHINKDHNDLKNSTIYTPEAITNYINKEIIEKSKLKVNRVFDPAIGSGNLVSGLKRNGSFVIGNDIEEIENNQADQFYKCDFEHFNEKIENIDLVIMNPPFNGHPKRKLYPEIFVDKCFELFGSDIPMIAILPSGWRINQRVKSKRWRKIRDNQKITSLVTLPLDIFEGVQFHSEIVVFNIEGLEPINFLDI
ncbi:TPA: hypothetical protein ACN35C_004689 [Vibrio parahaemolyticus]